MSPDKAHTVTMAAAQLYPEVRKEWDATLAPRRAVSLAAELYDLAVERVRASGPTSKPLKPQVEACSHCACRVCETEMKRREDEGE